MTIVQTWRIGGFTFLTLYAIGLLPGVFAIPAGLGDMLVGITAPLLAAQLFSGSQVERGRFIAWTVFGMLDLIVAVSLGVISSLTPLGLIDAARPPALLPRLPLSLIPTFAVPLLFILHIAAWLQVRRAGDAIRVVVDRQLGMGSDAVA